MKYIAMIPYYWGRGATLYEALQALKKTAGRISAGEDIILHGYYGKGPVWIDEMGSLCNEWVGDEMELERPDRPRPFKIGKGTIRGNSITFKKPED